MGGRGCGGIPPPPTAPKTYTLVEASGTSGARLGARARLRALDRIFLRPLVNYRTADLKHMTQSRGLPANLSQAGFLLCSPARQPTSHKCNTGLARGWSANDLVRCTHLSQGQERNKGDNIRFVWASAYKAGLGAIPPHICIQDPLFAGELRCGAVYYATYCPGSYSFQLSGW